MNPRITERQVEPQYCDGQQPQGPAEKRPSKSLKKLKKEFYMIQQIQFLCNINTGIDSNISKIEILILESLSQS